jgi:hypothetical protein
MPGVFTWPHAVRRVHMLPPPPHSLPPDRGTYPAGDSTLGCRSHLSQMWTSGRFTRTTMYELGAMFRVGHPGGSPCDNSRLGASVFTVLHTNGMHRVRVSFCGCSGGPERWRQLMRCRLWPATTHDPKTVATFDLLCQFDQMNAFGHINATDFYAALAHLTDAKREVPLPVSAQRYRTVSSAQRLPSLAWQNFSTWPISGDIPRC